MNRLPVVLILLGSILFACSGQDADPNLPRIGIDFVWDLKHPNTSPEIHLKNVPAGVERLDISFWDATNHWEHGGGTVPYDDSGVIRAGAVKGFKGLSTSRGIAANDHFAEVSEAAQTERNYDNPYTWWEKGRSPKLHLKSRSFVIVRGAHR
jgi:hypothetical protein